MQERRYPAVAGYLVGRCYFINWEYADSMIRTQSYLAIVYDLGSKNRTYPTEDISNASEKGIYPY